ncbi:phage tail tape measure protein [Exiguobacterium sp. 8H]|nr:phage tail tape measure protein [Exiguobacterium sp. 8H]
MTRTFGTATAVIAAGLGFATKTAMDFEAQMSRVAAVSGATGSDLKKLESLAREMGATTQFSASQAAEALNFMAMAGYDTTQMMNALPGVLDLAAAGGTELGLTADIVTDAMTGLGMKANETGRFVDVMAATITKSNTNVEMLGETMKYVAPVAGALGISIEDLSVAAGLMANAGVKASMAGTALRSGLTRLVDPPKEAADVMEKYGIELQKNADGSVNLAKMMQELRTKLSGVDKDAQAAAISSIFGQEAMAGWAAVVNASQSDFDKLTESIANSEGVASKIAKTMNDNLAGSLKTLRSAAEDLAIAIGSHLTPILRTVVDAVTGVINKFNSLSPTTQKIITMILLFNLALNGFLLFIGFVLTVVGNLILALNALPPVILSILGPVFIVIGALYALGVIFIILWNHSDTFRKIATQAWDAVSNAVSAAYSVMAPLIQALGKVIAEWAIAAVEYIVMFAGMVVPFLQSAGQAFLTLWGNITGGAGGALSSIGGFFSFILSILSPVIERVVAFGNEFQEAFKKALNLDFSGIAEIVAQFIPSLIGLLLGGIPRLVIIGFNIIQTIADSMGMTSGELITKVADIIVQMIESFTAQLSNFITIGTEMLTSIIEGLVASLPMLIESLTGIIEMITSQLTTNLAIVAGLGIEIITALVNAITVALPLLIEIGIQILTTLITGIVAILPLLITTAIEILNVLITTIVSLLPIIIDAGIQVLMALIQGIIDMLPALIDAAILLLTSLIDVIITSLPIVIDAGIQILLALIDGIIQILPSLIDAAIDLVMALVDAIIEMLPALIDAGIRILYALIDGIVQIVPQLIDAAIELVLAIVQALWDNRQKIIDAGIDLIKALIKGIWEMRSEAKDAMFDLGEKIIEEIKKVDLLQVGKDIINGLISGIGSMASAVTKKVQEVAGNIKDAITSKLDIHSPSRWMRDKVGKMIPAGIAVGIDANTSEALAAIDNLSDDLMFTSSSPVSGMMNGAGTTANTGDARPQMIDVSMYMDGELMARVIERFINTAQQDRTSLKIYAKGGAV